VSRPSRPRLPAIDIARTAALAGMVVFHFVVDLELFGHVPPGTTRSGLWPDFARVVAGSFLFLAGVSLWLAHGRGIRWRPFLRRLAVLALAAGGITLVTWLAMPERFVFFGILHSIAAASVIGLAFLRLPATVTLAAAAAVLAAPRYLRSEAFDAPWLLWLGLSERRPVTIDFEPVFPWLAPCLAGIAAAKVAERAGLLSALAGSRARGRVGRALAAPGRNSLWIYLAHQPVLVAAIWAAGRIF
jgi:uncharacterized membrane protein